MPSLTKEPPLSLVPARDRYVDQLLDQVRAAAHPSPQMLDRVQGSLRSRAHVEQYIEVLMDHARRRHPSLLILDRLDRSIALLELADQLQEQHEQRRERSSSAA